MAGSFVELNYHIVFSTKERRPILTADLRTVLFPYVSGILTNMNGHLLLGNGVEDHVHLLLRLHQDTSVAECVRTIKSNATKWIREQHRTDWLGWQDGYGAFTVSRSQLPVVERYLLNQEQHHQQQKSFQDEFRRLLRKHHIPFDEQYIWN